MKALLITEKPSVARDVINAYNKIKNTFPYDIDVTNARGHLLELCEPDEYKAEWKTWDMSHLPIIPDSFKTKIKDNARDVFKNIKDMYDNGNYDVIINGGDSGREGQLIQHLIYDELGVKKNNIPILRLWIDDTTEQTIIKGLNNLKPDTEYQGLTDASYLRLYLDWLVGINMSRGVTLALNRTSAIGRVMTAVLGLIVDREIEIKTFVPKDYHELVAEFKLLSGDTYKGKLINKNVVESNDKNDENNNIFAFSNKNELLNILKDIKNYQEGLISEIKVKENESLAPALFNLSNLQKTCAKEYGYSPQKTLEVAQILYEKHYLTYPRTDSVAISKAVASEVPDILNNLRCIGELSPFIDKFINDKDKINKPLNSKKYVDDSKVSDHPALLPTSEKIDISSLSEEEKNVYLQVAKRLVAIFLPSFKSKTTTAITDVDKYQFKSSGTVITDIGWKILYNISSEKEDLLPTTISQGANVKVLNSFNILDLQTKAPSRYNNASIIDAMETAGKTLTDEELEKVLKECSGLGTPATRGEILQKLDKDGYIITKGAKNKTLQPTVEGVELIEALRGHLIISAEFTAKWEKKLKEVENGTCSYNDFYDAIIKYLKLEISSLDKLKPLGPSFSVIGKCPLCKDRDFAVFKKYACCEGYTEKDSNGKRLCSLSINRSIGKSTLTENDVKELVLKGKTRQRNFIWNSGKSSMASLKLVNDEIDSITGKAISMKVVFNNDKESLGKCPLCKGNVYAGTKGYYCENNIKDNPNRCTFSIFGLMGKTTIKPEIIKEILENGETSKSVKITWESGKSYTDKLSFNSDFTKLEFKPFDSIVFGKCPFCIDGTITEEKRCFVCSNYSVGTCRFMLYKSYKEAVISQDDLKKLFEGKGVVKKITVTDFKTKKPLKASKELKLSQREDNGLYMLKYW